MDGPNLQRVALDVESRFEILDLFARYNHVFEAGDGEAWASCFTPDGRFSGPAGTAEGREELAELCRRTVQRYPVALHFTDHHLFEPQGEMVRHRCLLSVQAPTEDGVKTFLYRYDDELVQVEGRWRFRVRRVLPPEVAS